MRTGLETDDFDLPGADKSGSLRRLLLGAARMKPAPKGTAEDPVPLAGGPASDYEREDERRVVTVLPRSAPEAEEQPERAGSEPEPDFGGGPRDWSVTLSLVDRAVTAVRASEERAQHFEVHARQMAEEAENERMVARARIISAESRAEEAEARAEDAEVYARSIEERLREVELDLEETRARASEAETRAQEAEDWLRRLHDALLDQVFSTQIEGIVREYGETRSE